MNWDNIYAKIIETAKEVLGESRTATYLEKECWWWNKEVQEAVEKENVEFKELQQTRTNKDRDEYRTLNKSAKAEVAKTKEEAYKNLYAEVERNGPKVIYKLVKTRQRRIEDIGRTTIIKDKHDEILSKNEEIKNRMKRYFATLLNTRIHRKQLAVMQPIRGLIVKIIAA